MPAPYPTPTNITGIADLGVWANTVTGNTWGVGILLVTGIIFFAILNLRFSVRMSIGATAYIMSVLSILWRFAGQINDFIMFTTIVLSMCAILYLYFSSAE